MFRRVLGLRRPSDTASIRCAPSTGAQFRQHKRSTYGAAHRHPLEDATCSYCGRVLNYTYSCVNWKYTLGLVSHLKCILEIKVTTRGVGRMCIIVFLRQLLHVFRVFLPPSPPFVIHLEPSYCVTPFEECKVSGVTAISFRSSCIKHHPYANKIGC